ncbi:MAG: hypothetical protein ACPGAO_04140 [Flavobacteriaceae bacterium]
MKKFIKNNEELIVTILGAVWMAYDYISNNYEFDNFPNGIIIFSIGSIMLLGKYTWKKNKTDDDTE